jgi:hypothetical protein
MSVACSGTNIEFVAVARCSDSTVIGTWVASSVEHNATQYLTAVREVCSAPDFSSKVAVGQKVRFSTTTYGALSLIRDENRVYLAITTSDYPERLIFPFLEQVQSSVSANASVAKKSESCKECGLNKKIKGIVVPIVEEYDDPTKKDKLSAVQQKVDSVKLQMHSNIEGMLANVDKTEQLEKDAADLEKGANVFNKNAASLKKREQWKSRKLTIIIALIVAVILAVLIFTLVKQFQ